jgi:GT2 family glycosyltransferase
MTARPAVSVIICTKDRAQDIQDTLADLSRQTRLPAQVVIVDARAEDRLSAYLAAATLPFECRYIRAAPGVMRQRNIGVSNCEGAFVFCLDDDLILDPDFIEEMLKPLESEQQPRPAAVMGRIVEDTSWLAGSSWRVRLNVWLRQRVSDLFLLDKIGSGRFRYSGLASYPRDPGPSRFVECVSGGCAVYPRRLFDQMCYDETIYYPPLEDHDFSKRLADAGEKAYYQASARVLHKKSASGRLPTAGLQRVFVTHHFYMFRKNWPQTPLRRLAFWWSVLGLLLLNSTRPQQFKGVLAGIANILAGPTPQAAMQRLVPAP